MFPTTLYSLYMSQPTLSLHDIHSNQQAGMVSLLVEMGHVLEAITSWSGKTSKTPTIHLLIVFHRLNMQLVNATEDDFL